MRRIILTNDDGIEAPGMAALHRACDGLGERLVVAPSGPCSGTGHSVTVNSPLAVSVSANDWYTVGGLPADCTRLGLKHIAPDAEWVVAGINRGGNLGVDTYISGTVAAAREAAILGCKAIAISQYIRADLELDWEATSRRAAEILQELTSQPLAPGHFYNVNLPHLPPGAEAPKVVFCDMDPSSLEVAYDVKRSGSDTDWVAHYRGAYLNRVRKADSDVDVCFRGSIAVTVLPLQPNGKGDC